MKGDIGDDKDDYVKEIGTVDPLGDFNKMIKNREQDLVKDGLKQIQSVIERFIRSSLDGDLYDKAMETLKAFRDAGVSEDEAPTFNKFLEKIKDTHATGPHHGFFALMVKENISLITKDESEISSIITAQEAADFLKVIVEKPKG